MLEPFEGFGDAGVADFNVIEGDFSAFIDTEGVVGLCSYLDSPLIFPPTNRATVRVEFEVRYKTTEFTGPFSSREDPFHTQLVTGRGAVDVLTIKTDGISFPNSQPRTVVFEEAQEGGADVRLPRPPLIPTFVDSPVFPFDVETRELSVISTLSPIGSSCDPVQLKFNICNDRSTEGVSAAFIDEVQFDFTNRGGSCLGTFHLEEFPAPRE